VPHEAPSALEVLTADYLATLDDQGTYVPALTAQTTNPTLGTGGVATGVWQRNGHLITGWAFIRFGTSGTNAGSGAYFVSLPFPADTSTMLTSTGTLSTAMGTGYLRDNSAETTGDRQVISALRTADTVHLLVLDGTNIFVTNSGPFAWTVSDAISIQFSYLADPAGLP
jgi:hypothetical protein